MSLPFTFSPTLSPSAGAGCTVYDVVINTTFYTSARERPLLQNLLLTIVLEGLEGKYGILLSRGGCGPMGWAGKGKVGCVLWVSVTSSLLPQLCRV